MKIFYCILSTYFYVKNHLLSGCILILESTYTFFSWTHKRMGNSICRPPFLFNREQIHCPSSRLRASGVHAFFKIRPPQRGNPNLTHGLSFR